MNAKSKDPAPARKGRVVLVSSGDQVRPFASPLGDRTGSDFRPAGSPLQSPSTPSTGAGLASAASAPAGPAAIFSPSLERAPDPPSTLPAVPAPNAGAAGETTTLEGTAASAAQLGPTVPHGASATAGHVGQSVNPSMVAPSHGTSVPPAPTGVDVVAAARIGTPFAIPALPANSSSVAPTLGTPVPHALAGVAGVPAARATAPAATPAPPAPPAPSANSAPTDEAVANLAHAVLSCGLYLFLFLFNTSSPHASAGGGCIIVSKTEVTAVNPATPATTAPMDPCEMRNLIELTPGVSPTLAIPSVEIEVYSPTAPSVYSAAPAVSADVAGETVSVGDSAYHRAASASHKTISFQGTSVPETSAQNVEHANQLICPSAEVPPSINSVEIDIAVDNVIYEVCTGGATMNASANLTAAMAAENAASEVDNSVLVNSSFGTGGKSLPRRSGSATTHIAQQSLAYHEQMLTSPPNATKATSSSDGKDLYFHAAKGIWSDIPPGFGDGGYIFTDLPASYSYTAAPAVPYAPSQSSVFNSHTVPPSDWDDFACATEAYGAAHERVHGHANAFLANSVAPASYTTTAPEVGDWAYPPASAVSDWTHTPAPVASGWDDPSQPVTWHVDEPQQVPYFGGGSDTGDGVSAAATADFAAEVGEEPVYSQFADADNW